VSALPLPTRKDFLLTLAAGALLPQAEAAPAERGKLLIVAAHPDDEYAFAAATWRLVRECGWTADQVVITDGESGYRYASLAETFYGVALNGPAGRARLAEIRKQEVRNAGRILGIRHHYFLDQRDLGFDTDAASAGTGNWDRARLRAFLAGLLQRERYDAVFTLLPTAQTHGHHRAATLLTLEAVSHLSAERPLVFGAEPRAKEQPPDTFFRGLASEPLTRTRFDAPALLFDRESAFGYRDAMTYQIVANWLIAEHKSQGLFQMDSNRHRYEEFWLFTVSGEDPYHRLSEMQSQLQPARLQTAAPG
jgi:LmbE family N-acetylglucosaminyl deacetylase